MTPPDRPPKVAKSPLRDFSAFSKRQGGKRVDRFRGLELSTAVLEAINSGSGIVDLSGNSKRTDGVLRKWPSASLFVGRSITSLDLSGNMLRGSLADSGALWHALRDTLKSLDVSRIGLMSMRGLQVLVHLRVFKAAGNNLHELGDISLGSLEEVDISGNCVCDAQDATAFVKRLPALRSIRIRGNPLRHGRELLIFAAPQLAFVDGQPTMASDRAKAKRLFDPSWTPPPAPSILPAEEAKLSKAATELEQRNEALERLLSQVVQSHAETLAESQRFKASKSPVKVRRHFVPMPAGASMMSFEKDITEAVGVEEANVMELNVTFRELTVAAERLTECRRQCMAMVGAMGELDARLGKADPPSETVTLDERITNEMLRCLDSRESLFPERFVRETEHEYRYRLASRLGAAAAMESRLRHAALDVQSKLYAAPLPSKIEPGPLPSPPTEKNIYRLKSKATSPKKGQSPPLIPPPEVVTSPPKVETEAATPPGDAECDFVLNGALTGPRHAVVNETQAELNLRRRRLATGLHRQWGSRLEVVVVSARDLPPMKYARQSADAYVLVKVGSQNIRMTHVAPNTRYPEWRSSFALPASIDSFILFQIFDKTRVGSDDLIGEASVLCSKLADQKQQSRWLRLRRKAAQFDRVPHEGIAARTRLPPRAALRVELKLIHDRKALLVKAIEIIDQLLVQKRTNNNLASSPSRVPLSNSPQQHDRPEEVVDTIGASPRSGATVPFVDQKMRTPRRDKPPWRTSPYSR